MIGTIDCKTNDVDASVEDTIEVRSDGSVVLLRRTTFHSDSDEARPFRFFKNEFLGGTVDDKATLENDPTGELNVFTGRAPGHLVVDLEASVGSARPVVLTVGSELLPASRQSPLRYEVSFDSPQAVHYSVVLKPYIADLTAPERFQCKISPPELQARVHRSEATGEVHLSGSQRVSGATPPVRLDCRHEESLPSTKLLEYYREKFARTSDGRQPLQNLYVVLVLHLLADVRGFLAALLALGLDVDRAIVVNIPYSTKPGTVATLWCTGIRRMHLSSEYPLTDAVAAAVQELAAITDDDSQILVIEDGGYISPYLHRHQPDLLRRTLGIVEQTANGIYQYEANEAAGLEEITPRVPVVSVAESQLKKEMESPLIGDAVVRNVADLVGMLGYSIRTLRAVVLGYGATGSRVAATLRGALNSAPRVFDTDADRLAKAESAGFEVAADVAAACDGADLIIGCTGRTSLSGEVLLALRADCYFANGSSKRLELEWEALSPLIASTDPLPHGAGARVSLRNGRILTLLANGYPVNFFGESVPDEEIAFVYALLLRSALLVVEGGLAPGFHDVPLEIQEEIKRDHLHLVKQV